MITKAVKIFLWRYLKQPDVSFAVILTVSWQLTVTLFGYALDTQLSLPTTGHFSNMPEGLLGHTLRWDSGWYMEIIRSGFYQHSASSGAIYAFYPLYPLLVTVGSTITLGLIPLQYVSFLINTVAVFFILTGLMAIMRHFHASLRMVQLIAVLFLTSPAGMFLHAFYGEAIFIAIATWAYLFVLQRKWPYMAILLAILTAARLPAILFIGLCALEFLRSYNWKLTTALRGRECLWFMLSPIGFILYSAWSFHSTGDWLAMFHAYSAPDGWPYQVFNLNIFATLLHATTSLFSDLQIHGLIHPLIVNGILPLASIGALIATSLYALIRLKGAYIPLGIFGVVSVVLFTLNSNVVSVHRYTLACISIFIIAVAFIARHRQFRWVACAALPVSFTLQLGLLALYVTGHFAG